MVRRGMFTVTTHGIPKHKLHEAIFLNVDNVGRSLINTTWWKLMINHMLLQVVRLSINVLKEDVLNIYNQGRVKTTYQVIMRGTKHVMFVEKCFFLIVCYQSIWKHTKCQISQWHHCSCNDCDSKFKSKSELKTSYWSSWCFRFW